MHFRPRCVCVDCLRVSFGWLMSFWRIVRGCITEMGRGGACVPARVAPQGRICRSSPAHNTYILGMETPPCGRSGGHTGAAPTVSFGQIACGWLISFGWIMRGRLVSFGWIVCVVLFVGKTVHMNQHHRCCTFARPGLPTTGGYPGERRREGTYTIGIVLFKINLRVGKSFAACGNGVR